MDSPSAELPATPLAGPQPVPPYSPVPPPVPPYSPVPPERATRLPWVVAIVAVVVALVSVGALVRVSVTERASAGDPAPARPAPPAGEERGFASPEDAVDYFVMCVAAGDLAGATDAFTITSAVKGFSFEASSERLGAVSPATWLPEAPEYRAVNEGRRRGDVAFQLGFLIEYVAAPDRDFGTTQELSTDLTAADLGADLAPERLTGLSVIRVDDVIGPDGQDPGPSGAAIAGGYGADEFREVAVLYDTSEGPALGGVQLFRFGDEWFIWNLSSAVLGLSMSQLEPISETLYVATLAQAQG